MILWYGFGIEILIIKLMVLDDWGVNMMKIKIEKLEGVFVVKFL